MQSKGHLENIRAPPAMVTRKKKKRKDIPAKQAYINKNPKSSYQYLFSNSQSHDLKYVRNMVQKLD